jgi:hypothetical protein
MEYKEILAILLVLSILGVEPAGAVEIKSLNQVNSPNTLNLGDQTQNMVKGNAVISPCNNKGLNKLKMHKISINHKKTLKLIVSKVRKNIHHKLSRNSLTTTYNKGKLSHSFSHKVSTKDSTKSAEPSVISDDKNIKNEINMSNATGANGTVLNQIGNETVVNETAFNQTTGNETNVNGTILNNATDQNKTDFNQTGNGTVTNETNVNGTILNNANDLNGTVLNQTDNSTQESTKSHVLNTIENAGYFFAAVAAGAAALSACDFEPATKTILAGVAVGAAVIAAGCFVAHVLVDWFW